MGMNAVLRRRPPGCRGGHPLQSAAFRVAALHLPWAWFRVCHFWVTQGAWKPPACEGQISDTWLFVAGGDQLLRVKLAGAEAIPNPAGSASADGLGRSSTPAGSCPGARRAGCTGSGGGPGKTAAGPGMRHPVSTSLAFEACRVAAPGLKDASRWRSRRSPLAILDPGRAAPAWGHMAGTKERPFQPNQGTLFGSGDTGRSLVLGGIVTGAVLPGAPKHAHPGPRQDAGGVGVLVPPLSGAGVDVGGSAGGMARVVREAGDGLAQGSCCTPIGTRRRGSCPKRA